jgi:hypothetical protein
MAIDFTTHIQNSKKKASEIIVAIRNLVNFLIVAVDEPLIFTMTA